MLGKFKQKGNPFANRANRSPNPFRHETSQEHDQTIPGHEAGIDARSGRPGYDYTDELTSVVGEGVRTNNPDGSYSISTPTDYTNTRTGVFAGGGEEVIDTGGGTPPNNNPDNLSQEELNQNFKTFCELHPDSPKCDKFYNRQPSTVVNDDDIYSYSNREMNVENFPPPPPLPTEVPTVFTGGFVDSSANQTNQLKGSFEIPNLRNMNLDQLLIAKKKCGGCKSAGLINRLLGRRSG